LHPLLRRAFLVLPLLAACSTTAVTPSQPVLEGVWQLTFWAPASTPHTADSVTGVLELRPATPVDSALLQHFPQMYPDKLVGRVRVDFTPILGRQVSCLSESSLPPTLSLAAPDSIVVGFTPGAADCGLWATGRIRGDVVNGAWLEPTFAGPGLGGRFRMVRTSAPPVGP